MHPGVLEPFQLPFVQRGLLEILLLAVAAGLLGTWIVLRGLAFFSHAVGTAAFPGLVLADGLGFAAPLGAFGGRASSRSPSRALGRGRERARDSVTPLVLVGALAAGVILASDVFHSGANVETLLFGSLLLIDGGDIALAAVRAVALVAGGLCSGRAGSRAASTPSAARSLGARSAAARRAAAGPHRAGDHRRALRGRRPAGHRAARRPGRHHPAAVLAAARAGSSATVALVAVEGTVGLWLSVEINAPPGATIAVLGGGVFARSRRPAPSPGAAPRRRRSPPRPLALRRAGRRLRRRRGLPPTGRLDVVATTTQIGDLAREIGGGAVEVDQILQPNTDPHDYEPRPSDVEGDGRRGRSSSRAATSSTPGWARSSTTAAAMPRVVDLGADVPVRLPGESSGPEASRYDPHWWHDPRNAEAAVRRDRAPR